MKFSIGDRVLVKRTGEEGVILSFINKQLLEVEVDGVAFPVYADEVDHPYLTWFTAPPKKGGKRSDEVPVEKAPPPRPPQGLHLSFLPVYKTAKGEEEQVEHFKIYLLNETPYSVRFRYEARDTRTELFSLRGELQPFTNLYLHSLHFETVSATPRFLWEAVPVNDGKTGPQHKGELRIRPPKLFQHLQQSLTAGDPTFYVVLLPDFVEGEPPPILEGVLERSPIPVPYPSPAPASAPLSVVDLHLSALLGEGETLPREEALPLQLRVLRYALDEAIAAGLDRIIVVHGLGRGVLRGAVHEVLRHTPGVARFSDDWHPHYGFGATEVWFA